MYRIGLIGKMGAGKTFVSDALVQKYGGVRMAFADALKNDVKNFKLTPDGSIQKKRDRRVLQDYGQLRRGELEKIETSTARMLNLKGQCYLEMKSSINGTTMRNYTYVGSCSSSHWVDELIKNVKAMSSDESIIVDDIRRANEATALAENGFVILKLECPDEIRFERLNARDGSFDPETLNNISETEVDKIPYDYSVTNDGNSNPILEIASLVKQASIM